MNDLQHQLLDFLCWDERSFEGALPIDTDRIDVLAEIESAALRARDDGSWDDERRRRILERARARALESGAREAVAKENAARFLAALPPEVLSLLEHSLPPDARLPERLDRSLSGVATAIAGTLPRALRRSGEATLVVRREGTAHVGRWKDAGEDAPELGLDGVVALQFERMGEIDPQVASALARELFEALMRASAAVPGFETRRVDRRSFSLRWSALTAPHGDTSSTNQDQPAVDASPLQTVPEYAEVVEIARVNFASAVRDPEAVRIEPFVPASEPSELVPQLVGELAERALTPAEVVSAELDSLVDLQMHALIAKAASRDVSARAQHELDRALVRLRETRAVLGHLRSAGNSNRT